LKWKGSGKWLLLPKIPKEKESGVMNREKEEGNWESPACRCGIKREGWPVVTGPEGRWRSPELKPSSWRRLFEFLARKGGVVRGNKPG